MRESQGWTQRELAARLGTDAVTVSRWERGVSRPRPSALALLGELVKPLPDQLAPLVKRVGTKDAIWLLKRRILLQHRIPRQRFVESPTERLREVDRALLEQQELKARMRVQK